ncbi:polysaccharide biosynthesis/export family protein [Candidatus Magnetomonas plexicatena]|uniref:polysaccharide biosynthesis/export family protein n=1 Tax=Candidatus Magnetomonas plexicatena TaxID=2552947 RepID=UPI001102A663|nr:polysaccharide export protein [Nitrospirales bacterium LBB_01]
MRVSGFLAKMSLLIVFLLVSCSTSSKSAKFTKDSSMSDNTSLEAQLQKEPEFTLGPGDIISVKVHRHDDLTISSVRIRLDGKFTYPLIGDVDVKGKTVKTLEAEMADRLKEYIVNPQVMVNPTTITSHKVIVAGEITTPGVITMEENMTLLQAIIKCGGFSTNADKSGVVVVREGQTATFDVKKAFKGDMTQNIYLRSNDIVFVPTTLMADVVTGLTRLSSILGFIVSAESGIILTPDVLDILKYGKKSSSTGFSISN